MTREEKIEAYIMRLDGYTLQQIGDKFGVSRERIRQLVGSAGTDMRLERQERRAAEKKAATEAAEAKKMARTEKIVYSGIKKWAIEHGETPCSIANGIYGRRRASSVSQALTNRGLHGMCLDMIQLLLDYTGLTFEEAFKED